jgi:hypothetical protein
MAFTGAGPVWANWPLGSSVKKIVAKIRVESPFFSQL